jgi:hypothetical protein
MATGSKTDGLRAGLEVRGADGRAIGTIVEVWPDVGVGESWGSMGSIPMEGAEAADSTEYAYTEAMPGEGESYFQVSRPSGEALYVPFSAVCEVNDTAATLAVDAENVSAMQWGIKPDFLNIASEPDAGAGPNKA